MGLCHSNPRNNPDRVPAGNNSPLPASESVKPPPPSGTPNLDGDHHSATTNNEGKKSPFFPFYSPSPAGSFFSKKTPARSPANSGSTPKRFFKRPFPPPSPAKHIRAVLARRHGSVKPNSSSAAIPEEDGEVGLDKSFGFTKGFSSKYELGDEVGRGHFGYTCAAKFKKGDSKGLQVAVKVIPKPKVILSFFLFILI